MNAGVTEKYKVSFKAGVTKKCKMLLSEWEVPLSDCKDTSTGKQNLCKPTHLHTQCLSLSIVTGSFNNIHTDADHTIMKA